jgi:hypothetical protein
MPKRETLGTGEKRAERRKVKTIPKPATKSQDFGKIIFPLENRAMAQNIIETANPATRSNPLEVSTGIFVKGRKKIGNKTITAKSDQKEILSKVFDNIVIF